MDDIFGVSVKKIVETILAILAMVFFLIEKQKVLDPTYYVLLSIMVAVYLMLVVILGLARRGDLIGAGGMAGIECTFGVLLLLFNIVALGLVSGGLLIAAAIMEIVVGALFLIFIVF